MSSTLVSCKAGERVISGGSSADTPNFPSLAAIRSSFKSGNGWRTVYANDSGSTMLALAYAYCLKK